MSDRIHIQLHLWPWSAGIEEETKNLNGGSVHFPFYGSPVLSITEKAELILPGRYEKFLPFGPPYPTLAGTIQLFQAPHGVLARARNDSGPISGKVNVTAPGIREEIILFPEGAKLRIESGKETALSSKILAWSQCFDDLMDVGRESGSSNRLKWSDVEQKLREIAMEKSEPRRALIVGIAERLHRRISTVVQGPRRILLRERRMLPAGRIDETDQACLRWFVRQPGTSMAQKAAANRQTLMGVARRESFDTLENRVLKDFLIRCEVESRRYLNTEVNGTPAFKNSKRALEVKQYGALCAQLRCIPHLQALSCPNDTPRPNYVLQNDSRYRPVWLDYVRLLRKEEEEDRLWDWQARTWADVVRMLVNLSVRSLGASSEILVCEEMLQSSLRLSREQRSGRRVLEGSEPGPFLINLKDRPRSKSYVLEVVHPDQAKDHMIAHRLGRLGGHLYIILIPLEGGRPTVIVMWAAHTAGAITIPSWAEIGESAGRALRTQRQALHDLRERESITLRGIVVADDLNIEEAELVPATDYGVDMVRIPADQKGWEDGYAGGILAILEEIIIKVI